VLAALTVALLAAIVAAAAWGAVPLPPGNVLGIALHRIGVPIPVTWPEVDERILFDVRLPRIVTAIIVGAALSQAGVIFQALLRNPMADPYIIGTSGGAALGATLAMMLPLLANRSPQLAGEGGASAGLAVDVVGSIINLLGFTPVPLLAFLGALGAVTVVYQIARIGPRTPVVTLLLAGFATSSFLAALMSLLMLLSGSALQRIVFWTMGGLSTLGWSQIAVVAPLVGLGMALAYPLAWDLKVLILGEEHAASLGVPVERRKVQLLAIGSLLTGAAIALSGLVGFVGLVIPHLARLLLGPDHRLLLPASALVGAAFLLLADLVARTIIAPTEMPVGIVTALVGAPFFMHLLRRARSTYTF
jgi:iron complex transport system permease protein